MLIILKQKKVFKEYTIEVKMMQNQFNTKWTKFILQNRTFHNFYLTKLNILKCNCNRFQLTGRVDAVGVWIDEINCDPKVWLSQELMFVLLFQGCGFILYKSATT